jgi:hypothetical protein
MNKQSSYPTMQRMLRQLNRPYPNVGKFIDLNAVLMMFLIPTLLQMEKMASLDPSGYAPVLLVFGGFALLFIVAVVEMIIAVLIFSGIGWMMNVPGFFAIGVVQRIEGAEQRYRDKHIGFYRRFQGKMLLTGTVLIVGACLGAWMIFDWVETGAVSFPITQNIIMLLIIPVALAHLFIGLLSRSKQRKWVLMSDTQIRMEAELKRQRFPALASAPSIEEMESILRNAELGRSDAHTQAGLLDKIAHRELLGRLAWCGVIFFCILVLFL